MDFEITRFYRSLSGIQSYRNQEHNDIDVYTDLFDINEAPMGYHWDFTYNLRISFQAGGGLESPPDPVDGVDLEQSVPGVITVLTGSGRVAFFERFDTTVSPDIPTFSSTNPALYSTDRGSGNNELYPWRIEYAVKEWPVFMTDQDMRRYKFKAAYNWQGVAQPYGGRLEWIMDRSGNKIEFLYETSTNGVERIASAIDTLGNVIDFIYHDEPLDGVTSPLASTTPSSLRETLIRAIRDHTGRTYEYNYSIASNGDPQLESVSLPAIEATSDYALPPEHERFSNARKWQYEYTSVGDVWESAMLTSITNPNGDKFLEIDYSTNNGVKSRNTGRVLRETYGGANYNYIVTDLNGSIALPTSWKLTYDYYVWVNDRRGAITRFKYAGANSSEGFNRQLLEKTEFEGFMDDADKSMWAKETSPGVYDWFYLDESTYSEVDYSGTLKLADGTPINKTYTYEYETDNDWNMTGVTNPQFGNYYYTAQMLRESRQLGNLDPLSWGRMTERTRQNSTGSYKITERWGFEFDFGGSGGGCGCSTNSFATAHQDGNGNLTFYHYDSTVDSLTGRAKGDLLAIHRGVPSNAGFDVDDLASFGGSGTEAAAASTETFTYNDWGQIETHTHPSREILRPDDTIGFESRVDEFEYYASGPMKGRLKYQKIGTDLGTTLVTEFEYDSIGNVTKVIEPDGDIKQFIYNQDANLVREKHIGGGVLLAQTDYFYDANGNVVRTEIRNINENGVVDLSNPSLTTVMEYDTLDFPTATSVEHGVFTGAISESLESLKATAPIGDSAFVSEQFDYDGGKNIIKHWKGEALHATQAQASNVVEYQYDARDQLIKMVEGPGGTNPLVTEYGYDDAGRMTSERIASGSSQIEQLTLFHYDIFDRVSKQDIIKPDIASPPGYAISEFMIEYDKNNNITRYEVCGPATGDDPLSDPDTLLYRADIQYDTLDRLTSRTVKAFDYDYTTGVEYVCGQLTLPGSTDLVYTYLWNADSSIREIEEPSGDAMNPRLTQFLYDSKSRLASIADASGDAQLAYDLGSNLTEVIRTDISTLASSAQQFKVEYGYDGLDRRNAIIMDPDGLALTESMKYDSRSNLVEHIDARGNTTIYGYDSMSRLKTESRVMTANGDGTGSPLSPIVSSRAYDDSSRLTSETDDAGNTTTYTYDGLDRLLTVTMPDTSQVYTYTYDAAGNLDSYTDPRGVVVDQDFDYAGRLIGRTITNTGLDTDGGTLTYVTSESFEYDGIGRLLTAQNNFTKISRQYDSRSNLVKETQNVDYAATPTPFPSGSDRIVEYDYDGGDNMSEIAYPSGRVINRIYDQLNRLTSVVDTAMSPTTLTDFDYIGSRLERRTHGNGTQTDYTYSGLLGVPNAAGDHGFARLNSIKTTLSSTSAVLDELGFSWDKAQNKTQYNDLGSATPNRREREFGYDSFDRLASTAVAFPDLSATKVDDTTTYTLDDDHNRTLVDNLTDDTQFDSGAAIGDYELVGDPSELNQYTRVPRLEGGVWDLLYDDSGNLIAKIEYSVADWNGDYEFDFFDTQEFLDAYNNDLPEADLDGNGDIDFFDLDIFLDEYAVRDGTTLEHIHYFYDFRNQLVRINRGFGPDIHTTTNFHDPLARRVLETIDIESDDNIEGSKQLVYAGASEWEIIEQIDLISDTLLMTHVFGLGIDDEIAYTIENASPDPLHRWTHRDDQNTLTSVTDESGTVLERYEYGDYGLPTILTPAGAVLTESAGTVKAFHLYTGRPFIAHVQIMDFRYRTHDPVLGRFMQRDPLWHTDSMNLYAYVVASPLTYLDPFGLSIKINFPSDPEGREAANRLADALEKLCPNVSVNRENGEVSYEEQESGGCDDETKELCSLLKELVGNDKNNIINVDQGMMILKNAQAIYIEGEDGENLGTEILIHPNTKIQDKKLSYDPDTDTWTKVTLERTKSTESTLAHELGHVLDYNRNGQYGPGSGYPNILRPGGYPPRESTAIFYENQQRAREGLPARTFY